MENIRWHEIQVLLSRNFTCGYCSNPLASQRGWQAVDQSTGDQAFIYVCHFCHSPTFFDTEGNQYPAEIIGQAVNDIPEKSVEDLYEETRRVTGVGAYTAAVLSCRKLLMHIAVSKGAPEGKNFIDYVEYLSNNHYVPPDAKDWVDQIRKKGNEANHEITIMSRDDAEELLAFVGMLMKVIYEFPARIKRKAA